MSRSGRGGDLEEQAGDQVRVVDGGRAGPSRRSVVRGAALAALWAAAGCSGEDPEEPDGSAAKQSDRATAEPSGTAAAITWANWPDYIDVSDDDPDQRPTLAAFTEETGIQVDYREDINDNQEFVDGIEQDLSAKRPVGYDVMALTSWMSARLVRAGQVQRLDRSRIPNAANLVAALSEPGWDPGRDFSMPWQAGLTGIAYDARQVERAIGSVDELLERSDLTGRVGFLTEFSDTIGMVVLASGGNPTDLVTRDVEAAVDRVAELQQSGQVTRFYGNDFVGALRSGEIAACLAWSGDVLQMQLRNPNIKFVVPEEGLMIWSDDMLVPRASTKGAAVARLIDYYYDPKVAAKVAAWVNYICPVEGAQEEMQKIDPDLALSPLIFPDTSVLDASYQFQSLPEKDDIRLRKAFSALTEA
jgi:spermidine/putrescine transport system substrate-binding protein